MISIYDYSEPHLFIKDSWQLKKTQNPAFSLRAWSKKLGLKSNSPLTLILQGKRSIPLKYIPEIINSLGLDTKEGLYLEALIKYHKEKDIYKKSFYYEQLKLLTPSPKLDMDIVNSFKYLSNPLFGVILEMIDLKIFNKDAKWIKEQLSFETTIQEINDVVNTLIDLKLIAIDQFGNWKKAQAHISGRPDIVDEGIQKYHQTILNHAKSAIKVQDILKREFNSYSLNIKQNDIPKAKKLIRGFINEFIQQMEAPPSAGDENYQLSIQFFANTSNSEKS